MVSNGLFDVLTADVRVLQKLLGNGTLRSTDLVKAYRAQIDKYDGHLHAMLSMPSLVSLLAVAEALDGERSNGNLRGPLHGIPVILKVVPVLIAPDDLTMTSQDNIATIPNLGMQTSAGSLALLESEPPRNAKIVDKVVQAHHRRGVSNRIT